jgi:hypothetical protein
MKLLSMNAVSEYRYTRILFSIILLQCYHVNEHKKLVTNLITLLNCTVGHLNTDLDKVIK